ncbi:hypothetical protein KFE25_006419 [Diacronema lutheri]|uniref:25S rRNA (uridine-N(3))-methyltransferase BMT5-like domain-containing protein n=1 Tax=Diacronema lutheri TaxID=2081491 RepID=A0A8J5XT01_DIALT|nr:hypothetical protein KFE25_006419 [Diacronema lutheri]
MARRPRRREASTRKRPRAELPALQEGSLRHKRRAERDDYRALCRSAADGDLHCHRDTLCCAAAGCTVCAYRLVVRPALVSAPGARFRQNARPHECARMRLAADGAHADGGGIYAGCARVLAVGDGDLSFSLALCRGLRSGAAVTATTHLSRTELDAAYGCAAVGAIIDALGALGARVVHGVDATRLDGVDASALGGPFDRIVFNFPCVASADGAASADGQLAEMAANAALLRAFFAHAHRLLAPGGELHVAHKTKPPFSHWRLAEIAAVAAAAELEFAGRVVFDPALHIGYAPRKVATGAGGSFPTFDAVVHVWRGAHPAGGAAASAAEGTLARGGAGALLEPEGTELVRRCRAALVRAGARALARSGASLAARVSGAHCVQLTEELLDAVCARLLEPS